MKLLNEAQEEHLQEIGANLRQVRQEKSIRIEEIAAQTRIRLSFLQAIEEGRFEDLPEPVFVQGFIRRYGDAVGMDGTGIAQTFAANCLPVETDNESQNLEKKPEIYIPLVIPYILLLAVAVGVLFFILNPQLTALFLGQKQNPQVASNQKTIPTPVALLPIASTPSPTAYPKTHASSTVKVTLELQGKSWLQVKADGKTTFKGILTKGARRTWTAKKSLTVRSGNAGAVLVSTNNKEPKLLGNQGEVKQVTFTPEVKVHHKLGVKSEE